MKGTMLRKPLLSLLLAASAALAALASAPLAAETEDGMPLLKKKPIYVSMLPHFTVNLQGGGVRFMRLKANTLVANDDTKQALKLHMPAVRHNVLMKLAHLSGEDLDSGEDKDALREEIANIIRDTLREAEAPDDVRGFFITSLVIQ